MIDSELEREYQRLCTTPSDIYLHLPTFVRMACDLNAQHIIELGTRSGVSTVAWLYAMEATGGRVDSVDIDPAPPLPPSNRWTFHRSDDLDADLLTGLDMADIVFIDTSHHYRQTLAELHVYSHLVRRGGFILLHDTELARPEGAPPGDFLYPVKRAIERFVGDENYQWTNDPRCYGLGIIEVA